MRSPSFIALLSVVLLSGWIGEASARCEGKEVQVRFTVPDAKQHPVVSRVARLTASTINVEMQGKACLVLIEDAKKFDGLLVVNSLTGAEIELALIELSRLTTLDVGYQIFQLPFVFRDYRTAQRFVAQPAVENMAKGLERSGLLNKGTIHGGFAQLTAKRPLLAPSDLLGLRFRPAPFDKTGLGQALRAVPEKVLDVDLDAAIKDGRVEAQSNDWSSIRRGKHAKLHDGVTISNHAYRGYGLVLSKQWWDGQTPTLRKELQETFARVIKQTNFETGRRMSQARRLLLQSGASVRLLTRTQRQKWREAVAPVWDRFSPPERQALFDALKAAHSGP